MWGLAQRGKRRLRDEKRYLTNAKSRTCSTPVKSRRKSGTGLKLNKNAFLLSQASSCGCVCVAKRLRHRLQKEVAQDTTQHSDPAANCAPAARENTTTSNEREVQQSVFSAQTHIVFMLMSRSLWDTIVLGFMDNKNENAHATCTFMLQMFVL